MKFNMKHLIALLSLLLVVAVPAATAQRRRGGRPAAKAPAPAPAAVAGDYFPLRAGDTWTYRHSEGNEFTVKVLKEEKQPDGTLRYVVESQSGALIHYIYSKPAGWVLLHRTDYLDQEAMKMNFAPPRRYLKNPLKVGDSWRWGGKDVTGVEASESSRVVGQEWVDVPAGRFHAMKIVSQVSNGGSLINRTTWYAPGVGCVKVYSEAGEIKYGYELTDYSFKNASPK